MTAVAYFDSHAEDQRRTMSGEGNWVWCYRDQVEIVEPLLRPCMTVLDVGCGPSLPYRAPYAYVIGLDPSAESLARNTDVDERLCASATEIPLPDASVDLVVAFYSLHHMTGSTFRDSQIRADAALAEMGRVLTPSGTLLIFEMRPQPWAYQIQRWLWAPAKWLLGNRLDACFLILDLDDEHSTIQTFNAPWHTPIAPILSLPWLKVPRILWPFTPTLYRWSPGGPC